MFNNRLVTTTVADNEAYNEFLDKLNFDYSQIYRGIVVDNDDPLKLGRVRVRVPQIHGSEDNKDSNIYLQTFAIPWATSAVMVGAGNNTGSYLIPNIGDIVFVTFEGGSAKYPIYFGGIINKYKDKSTFIGTSDANGSQLYDVESNDFNTDITNGAQRVIYKSIKGATIIIDDSDRKESIKIIDQLGQIISMENTSDEILQRDRDKTATGNKKFKKGKIVLQSSMGNTISISDDEIYIKAPKVRIDTDDYKVNSLESDFGAESNEASKILGLPINLLDTSKGYDLAYIDASGNYKDSTVNALYRDMIRVSSGIEYKATLNDAVDNIMISYFDSNNTFVSRQKEVNISEFTFIVPEGVDYMKVGFNYDNNKITDEVLTYLNLYITTDEEVEDNTSISEPGYTEELFNMMDEILDYKESDTNE